MLEGYLYARDKYENNNFRFLKDDGKMYPSGSTMFFMPFCDDILYKEQISKVSLWDNENFFGLNLTCNILI
jgi:hypothetical protein